MLRIWSNSTAASNKVNEFIDTDKVEVIHRGADSTVDVFVSKENVWNVISDLAQSGAGVKQLYDDMLTL